jgi:hypothetical protein
LNLITKLLIIYLLSFTILKATPEYGDVYEDVKSFKYHQVCYQVLFPDKKIIVFNYYIDIERYAKIKKFKNFKYRDCANLYPYKKAILR